MGKGGTKNFPWGEQTCQNVLAAGNFATFSQFLAVYSTLDLTRSPLAGKGTWCLLPTTGIPSMLPAATKHFDGAGGVWIFSGAAHCSIMETQHWKFPYMVAIDHWTFFL